MNYTAFPSSKGLDIYPFDDQPSTAPEVSYASGQIKRVSLEACVTHEYGIEVRACSVVIGASMDDPAQVLRTLEFSSFSDAERFYGGLLDALGWT